LHNQAGNPKALPGIFEGFDRPPIIALASLTSIARSLFILGRVYAWVMKHKHKLDVASFLLLPMVYSERLSSYSYPENKVG